MEWEEMFSHFNISHASLLLTPIETPIGRGENPVTLDKLQPNSNQNWMKTTERWDFETYSVRIILFSTKPIQNREITF